MKLKLSFAALAILVLASVLLVACSSSPGEDIPAPGNTSTAEVAPTGEEIFASNCAACHGADGEGQPDWHVRKTDGTLPPPPLNGDGHTWHHADGLLYEIVSQGGKMLEDPSYPGFKSAMPAFGDRLSHEQIIEVLTYVKSLWGDKTSRGLSIVESQALVSELAPCGGHPVGWGTSPTRCGGWRTRPTPRRRRGSLPFDPGRGAELAAEGGLESRC